MSRTITAMFDTRADADAAKQRLATGRIDADNVRIHDQTTAGSATDSYSTHQDVGMWASIKNAFLPDEDRHTYEEGVRRGGFLLTADVDEGGADEAVRVLEGANTVDIDERAGQWKSQGWNNLSSAGMAVPNPRPTTDTAMRATGTSGNEEHIDIVEEQLVVGKREVNRGNVRVRSYVTEKPVHEQIRLRDETIKVDRHPVDRKLDDTTDAFRDRTIEMREIDEEAVVGKTARVVEEVVVRKTAEDRVEDINETVRRTDVEVENLGDAHGSSLGDRLPGSAIGAKAGTAAGVGATAGGLGKEALGNVKQGLGNLTGNEDLKRSGEAQERAGEQRQGKRPD